MEVADIVEQSGRAPQEVVAELRPGYRRHGRVFRFAQVSVAR
jgi:molecular chaperone GrpE (heat shock protein)